MRPVDVLGLDLGAEHGSPLVVLREQDAPHRLLLIHIGGHEALSIALALTGESPPRPLTHDLLAALIDSLDARVDHVELTELRAGTFLAEMAVRGPHGAVSIDSRPSDAIAVAVRADAPLFASDAVLAEAGVLATIATDEQTIDEDVDRFREFLNEVDPADFDKPEGRGHSPDDPAG
jgi:uncharacterized protein